MRLWVNVSDIRPAAPYLVAWLNHVDGVIAHRVQDRIFARDWKWLVLAPPGHSGKMPDEIVQNSAFAARYVPGLASLWVTFEETDRRRRQALASDRRMGPLGLRSRRTISFWESIHDGAVDVALRCKDLASQPVPPRPASRDVFPSTFSPVDPLRFTHGLALRIGFLTGRELQHMLQTVGELLQTHASLLPTGTDVWWRIGLSALDQMIQQWPTTWPLWGEEHVTRQRAPLSLVLRHKQDLFLPSCDVGSQLFPLDCELFMRVIAEKTRQRGQPAGAMAPPPEVTALPEAASLPEAGRVGAAPTPAPLRQLSLF